MDDLESQRSINYLKCNKFVNMTLKIFYYVIFV